MRYEWVKHPFQAAEISKSKSAVIEYLHDMAAKGYVVISMPQYSEWLFMFRGVGAKNIVAHFNADEMDYRGQGSADAG